MSRIVTLSLTLKLEVASQLTRPEFYDHLESFLRTGLGDVLAESTDAISILSCSDPENVMSTRTELSPLLTPAGEIAVVWSFEDVLEIRPDLTQQQAISVLLASQNCHDAGVGINWHSLECAAEELFGSEPESDHDACQISPNGDTEETP